MSHVFIEILVVLVAAKIAAELAERAGVPAVVGEILAGIAIGPSALNWVKGGENGSEVLHTLGEIGVILLLLEVGMQMDLRELKAVGRSSMSVAVVGVAAPMAMGYGVALAFDLGSNGALFVAAALTATSVGITARVFGDLRALATVEARTVLGAAVADDVMGLVILTVVVRIVTGSGSVSVASVGWIIFIALAFLIGTTVVGTIVTPRLFGFIDRMARSSGTLVALGLAFTLAVAELASLSKLAPIVGAFVAGLALGRSEQAPRIHRELTPVGHLFIPVFFLQIGIETNVEQFAKPAVLGMAGALIVVAVVGKVIAGWATFGAPGNKLLIGLGMIPRGEVGLIFAGIGLREAILGENAYAALLLMVLFTTLMTPPLLRWQLTRVRKSSDALLPQVAARPPEGWLSVHDGVVDLVSSPPDAEALTVALEAAVLLNDADPGPALIAWAMSEPAATWDSDATEALFELLERGTMRSWRFLETTGLVDRAIPELAATLKRRRSDPALIDPTGVLRWPFLEQVQATLAHPEPSVPDIARLAHPRRLLLAALLMDATADDPTPARTARSVLSRLVLSPDEEDNVAMLVSNRYLLRAAAVHNDGLGEDSVLRIAAHLGSRERARGVYILSIAANNMEPWERRRLDTLHELVMTSLSRPELTSPGVSSLVDARRAEAIALVPARSRLGERIAAAPRAYILSQEPADVARQVALIQPLPTRGKFQVSVRPDGAPGRWRVEIGGRDQIGLLGIVTGVLEQARLDVLDAVIVTWPDGGALQAFRVASDVLNPAPDATALERELSLATTRELTSPPVIDARVTFDDAASPWHTLAEVQATDRRGLLHALAVAFAAAGADVHAARITTTDEMALDRFDLTDRDGRKINDEMKDAIRRALQLGVLSKGRTPWRPAKNRVGTIPKHSVNERETTVA